MGLENILNAINIQPASVYLDPDLIEQAETENEPETKTNQNEKEPK